MDVTVRRTRAGIDVSFPYDPSLVQVMHEVPGAEWDRTRKVWRLPHDAHALSALLSASQGYSVDLSDEVAAWAHDALTLRDDLIAIRAESDADLTYERASDLRPYQRVAVEFFTRAGGGLLADEMGLGKTVTLLAALREIELRRGAPMNTRLIVCPNSMRHTWEAEIRAWYPENVDVFHVDRERELRTLDPGFYIVNWERTHRRALLAQIPWEAVVCDESHRMKGRDTKQSKAVRKFHADHRFALTGTPIKNDVTDLWPQLNFLEPSRWSSYWKFFNRYVRWVNGIFGREIVGMQNVEELTDRLATVMLARTVDEVDLQLPPLIERTIQVTLEGAQRRAYDEMRDEFVAHIQDYDDDDTLTAANWMTQILRLKQIAGSLGIFSDTDASSSKIDALLELLDEAGDGEKFVVMSQFKTMVDQVTTRLRAADVGYCEMTGSSAVAWMPGPGGYHHAGNRAELIDWFQRSDKPRVFIATTQTGGEGITLTAARYFVFMDLLWTPGDNAQAMKRIHRIGQGRTCFVYRILARDTVDYSTILPKLRGKQAIIDAIMVTDDV